MKLQYFYLGLNKNDFSSQLGGIVSDFNFQTDYFTHYIEKKIKNKYSTENFNFIYIRPRINPVDNYFIDKDEKTLTIEISFDKRVYEELYPQTNHYPLGDEELLKPIKNEDRFNFYVYELIMEGLHKAKSQNAPIPVEELIQITNNFKKQGFKNEWVFKKKHFKDYNIEAQLICTLNCNYFSLRLRILKNNIEVLDQEILKTLPNSTMYKNEFHDIVIDNDVLKISRKYIGYLFEIPLLKL